MTSHFDIITYVIECAATSIGRSFANYWPANDENDPVENNASIHVAHVLLADGFSAFAEADHPDRQLAQGIDLFAVAPANDWFLACEFKKIFRGESIESMSNDVDRLAAFWLRTNYAQEMYGDNFARVASGCKIGYGLVGGLHWLPAKSNRSKILDIWTHPDDVEEESSYGQFAAKLHALGAILPEPPIAIQLPTGNRYYFLSAIFPLPIPATGETASC